MTGSIQEKHGKLYAVLCYKDVLGKPQRKGVPTNLEVRGNKKRAESMLPGIIEEYLYLEPNECKSVLFVDYIREWLIRKKADVQLSTWEGYEIYVTRHIIPYFEPLGLNIDQVTPKHIQDYYESRLNCQRPDHKAGGLKPVSVKKHAPVLNQIFEAALIEELVLRNPVSVVPLPKQEKREPVGKFMSAEEAGRMLEAFDGHELQALINVTLYYGLRRSEVLGLKWDAVDFDSDTLKIQHTVVKQKTIIAKDSTKSMTSRRVYPLLKEVKKLLVLCDAFPPCRLWFYPFGCFDFRFYGWLFRFIEFLPHFPDPLFPFVQIHCQCRKSSQRIVPAVKPFVSFVSGNLLPHPRIFLGFVISQRFGQKPLEICRPVVIAQREMTIVRSGHLYLDVVEYQLLP